MSVHAYPAAAMIGDYLRAAGGLVPAVLILALSPFTPVAGTLLSCFAAVFLVFGLRTALRHGTRIELTETGIDASGPLGASIRWSELNRLSLAYYSTHRDRRARPGGVGFGALSLSAPERLGSSGKSGSRDGWMQLRLRAGGSTLRLDSRIEGFPRLVEQAARAAEARRLPLSAATAANLEALGIRVLNYEPGRGPPAGAA